MNLPTSRDIKHVALGVCIMAIFLLIIPTEEINDTHFFSINKDNDYYDDSKLSFNKKCQTPSSNNIKNFSNQESLYQVEMPSKIKIKKYRESKNFKSDGVIKVSTNVDIYDSDAIEEQLNIELEDAGLVKAEKELKMLKLAKLIRDKNTSNDMYIVAKEDFELAELQFSRIQEKINHFKENKINNEKIRINLKIPHETAEKLFDNKIMQKTISYDNNNQQELILDNTHLTLEYKDGNYTGIIEVTKDQHNADFFNNNRNINASLNFYLIDKILDKNEIIYTIPKTAIYNDDVDDYVWIINPEKNTAIKHKIKVTKQPDEFNDRDIKNIFDDKAYVAQGINSGDIILSNSKEQTQEHQKLSINN